MHFGNLHQLKAILSRKQRLQTESLKHVPTLPNSSPSNGILKSAIAEIRQRLHVQSCQFLWHHLDRAAFNPGCQRCSFERICSGCVMPNPTGDEILEGKLWHADDTERDGRLAIAVKTRSGERGVLVCERGQSQPMWCDEEVAFLRVLAHRLTLAIDRARRVEP